ncbi:MAG TPA: hypothetical protein ENI20_18415 [Bacteroides sp.]|nr:hypothetical protein [Bacteroides sp.]
MNNRGYISINRTIREHWIWKDPYYRWWCDLLMEAKYKPDPVKIGWKMIPCGRGQIVCSQRFFSSRWNVDRSNVRRFLDLLLKHEMISIEPLKGCSRMTVLNYEKYQYLVTHLTSSETEPSRDERPTSDPPEPEIMTHLTDSKTEPSRDDRPTQSKENDPNINKEDSCLREKISSLSFELDQTSQNVKVEAPKDLDSEFENYLNKNDSEKTEKKITPAGYDKYLRLEDKYKTFSILNALKGEPITEEETEKVETQVKEYFPEPKKSNDENFWNDIAEEQKQ